MKRTGLFLWVALLGLCCTGFVRLRPEGSAGTIDANDPIVLTSAAADDVIYPGDRVVLLQQSGDLSPGHGGTVLGKGPRGFLVNWDAWNEGAWPPEIDYCSGGPIGDVVIRSAGWVTGSQLALCIDRTGVLVQGVEGCILFRADNGQRFVSSTGTYTVGARVRVQGLLPPGGCWTFCEQGDGCIKHAILSDAGPGPSSCCDPNCIFRPGDRVVLLDPGQLDPTAPKLQAGVSGTLLSCVGAGTPAAYARVSWDLLTSTTPSDSGKEGNYQYPKGSLGSVYLKGLGKYTDLGCAAVKQRPVDTSAPVLGGPPWRYDVTTPTGVYTFAVYWDGGFTITACLADWTTVLRDGADVHVRGIVDGAGTLIDPILTPCEEPSGTCCGLKAGDRVVLLVNTPPNTAGQPAVGLYAGMMGTVLCCDSDDPIRPLFVSWDNWTGGTNYDGPCDIPPASYAPYSGWWMQCSDIRLCTGNCGSAGSYFAGCGTLLLASTVVGNADFTYLAFQADSGTLYSINTLGGFQIGDRVWLEGPVNPTGTFGVPTITVSTIRLCSDSSTCQADLCQYAPAGVGFSPTSIQAGQTLTLHFGAGNCGSASIAAGWRVRYYASADTIITPSDYLLSESVTPVGLGPGQQAGFEEELTFPGSVPAGQYYVGWILDPDNQICEANENNNAGYIANTRLTVGTPSGTCNVDFCQYEPFDTGFSPTTVRAGQSLYMSFGLANCGTASIPSGWKIRYYASTDTTITSSDYFLSESVADFAIGVNWQISVEEEFIFPSGVPAGQYYLGWILDPDNQICESNENNNAGCIRGMRLTVVSGSMVQ